MRKISASYDAALEPVGINTAQFSLMRTVSRREPLTLTELARQKDLDRSTIGRNVRVLERLGMLALGRGKDQREATVSLTDKGRDALEQGGPLWDAAQGAFEARLGPDAVRNLLDTLHSI